MDRDQWGWIFWIYCIICLHGYVLSSDEYESEKDGAAVSEGKNAENTTLFANVTGEMRMIAMAATRLAQSFHEASVDELGLTALTEIVSSFYPTLRIISDDDLVLAISDRLSNKLNTASHLLTDMKTIVNNDTSVQSFTYPCSLSSIKRSHHLKDIDINSEKVILNIPKSKSKISKQLSSLMKMSGTINNVKIKRRYFMSAADAATDQLCGFTPPRSALRKLFHHTFQPEKKQLILIVDNGKKVSKNDLRLATSIAKELLNILQNQDSVGLIFVSGIVDVVKIEIQCDDFALMGPATDVNKELFFKHLTNTKLSNDISNISIGIDKAFEMFTSQQNYSNAMIVYLGPHLAGEVENISEMILHPDKNLVHNIIISSCNLQNAKNSSELNKLILNSKALCTKTKPYANNCIMPSVNFNSSFTLGQVASFLMLNLERGPKVNETIAAQPFWDTTQRDVLMPLLLPCGPRGVLALELYLSDITEDIIYFNSLSPNQRAFIIDFSGNVIMHSSFSRPEVTVPKPRLIDIALMETHSQFHFVKADILSNSSGVRSIKDGFKITLYTWKWIKKVFIVCVVSEKDNRSTMGSNRIMRMGGEIARELQYHRIDLLPPPSTLLCRHFKQISTIEKGTLYLSPSSFQSPFMYLYDIRNGKDTSFALIQSYMAYLKDPTRLLSNPGLKSDIRNDVGILYPMLSYFKRQHIHGAYNKYIVRRYAATEHGVLVMFPGSILKSDYEPNRKAWFMRALENPGKIILTPPYLDVGGAGYIVSVSHVLPSVMNNLKPDIVVSMDMTMGFLYKILMDHLPQCSQESIKCFMMDDRGYLLSHPSLLDAGNSGPIEQQHITHKESLIANDILNRPGFIQKKQCKNLLNNTLQRYYKFNTSLDEVLTNLVNGEHSARYHIAALPGTNAFVGTVNSSFKSGAFCPCSVVDRLCLNCNRMEQNECECPCECNAMEDFCEVSTEPVPIVPLCEQEPESDNHRLHYFHNFSNYQPHLAMHLSACFDFQCESYETRSSCMGVLGCEWCQLDVDAESPLSSPFCSAQSACFSGVLGAVTPYGEGPLGRVMQDDLLGSYSAIGPIAGCIVALCLILAIAVYCYKQNLTIANAPDNYLGTSPEAWPDVGIQMSPLPSEDDIHDDRAGHQDQLLLTDDPVPPISPYRILTGYRRPNTTGESDHGYSTMTPHDDSEHLAFALAEPLMVQESLSLNDSDRSPSISTPRSMTSGPMETVLPCGKNTIIAPVTVHRHMEAT